MSDGPKADIFVVQASSLCIRIIVTGRMPAPRHPGLAQVVAQFLQKNLGERDDFTRRRSGCGEKKNEG
jgi:hypothetical protein